jgi:sugar O-acyltransferase (sialic acid O-acetyltransferase NeuD family)
MSHPHGPRLRIVAVATPYVWDVVESGLRAGRALECVDNFGGADAALPGLCDLDSVVDKTVPWTLGLSSATHRGRAAQVLAGAGFPAPTALVDPTAIVGSTVTIAHGAYVNAGAVVGSHTRIGCHANVNRSASVGHDCDLGFASSLGPGVVLTGHVRVGASAFVGAGAVVLPGVTVGEGAVVGAGAVVTRDVPERSVQVGSPARPVRTHEEEVVTTCPHCSKP